MRRRGALRRRLRPAGNRGHRAASDVVQAAADDKSDRPVKFVVVDPVEQRSFAAAFEVTADDVPAVSVVSMRKNRFATYRATFSAERIAVPGRRPVREAAHADDPGDPEARSRRGGTGGGV